MKEKRIFRDSNADQARSIVFKQGSVVSAGEAGGAGATDVVAQGQTVVAGGVQVTASS